MGNSYAISKSHAENAGSLRHDSHHGRGQHQQVLLFISHFLMRQPTFRTLSGLAKPNYLRNTRKPFYSPKSFRTMASHASDHGVENTNINIADGVTLNDKQRALVGCTLDVNTLNIHCQY